MGRPSGSMKPPSLRGVYRRLRRHFGPAHWWPGDSPLEIALGAILTQNTAWANVERALRKLRERDLLRFETLIEVPRQRLEGLLRPAGTFRVKTRRVRAFLAFVRKDLGGRVERLADLRPEQARRLLLGVHGIGPETADAIALYAVGHPLFVVDAYTRRILQRLALLSGGESYDEVQAAFVRALPRDAALFNDYHAQLVRLGQEHCRRQPRCGACPLGPVCPRLGVARPRQPSSS